MSDMSNENEDFLDKESSNEHYDKGEIMGFLAEFIKDGRHAEKLYRENFCELVVNKVFYDFGYEGLCNLMIQIDTRAKWISDILIENSDFDDILFKKYGVYDSEVCDKARDTEAMMEMNSKIWRLRKKYAPVIVDEIMLKSGK